MLEWESKQMLRRDFLKIFLAGASSVLAEKFPILEIQRANIEHFGGNIESRLALKTDWAGLTGSKEF
jgi:hypothetical protein